MTDSTDKCTPAPWVVNHSQIKPAIDGADGSRVASCAGTAPGYGPRSQETLQRRRANARLIVRSVNSHTALLTALRAADQWIKLLVEEMDIEPADTTITVNAVSPDGRRELAKMNLAKSQEQFAAAIAQASTEDR